MTPPGHFETLGGDRFRILKMNVYDEASLLSSLSSLPLSSQSAFAQACAHRTFRLRLPPLEDEAQRLCDQALRAAAAFVGRGSIDRDALQSMLKAIDASQDPDDDRMAACAYVVGHLLSGEPQEAAWSARRAYDGCDALAQAVFEFDVFTKDVERLLLEHPVVQAELAQQAQDLRDLQADPSTALAVTYRASRQSLGDL